jgi:hypothetical protein
MRSWSDCLRPALALFSLMVPVGCTPQRMAVPPDLTSAAQLLPIEDRSGASGSLVNEGFRFGPYRVSDVDRDWNRSGAEWAGWNPFKSRETTRGGYAYKFSGGGGTVAAHCMTSVGQEKLSLPVVGELTSDVGQLACRCQGAGMAADGVVEQKNGDAWEGQVNSRGGAFALASVSKLENGSTSMRPTGFEARAPQRSVAAVETLRPGRVWLATSLDAPTQAELACLFAGFLLFQPPSRSGG